MQRGDRISGAFWLIFSLVIIIESYKLGLGTLDAPQAGFLPFAASLILGALSFILLINTIGPKSKISEKGEDLKFNRQKLPKILYVVISLFAYVVLLNTLGFILDTMILIGFLLAVVEPQRWYVVITGAISTSLIFYVIFDVFLKVQMPKGFLSF